MTEAKDEDSSFAWTGFYEAVAERLLDYRDNRAALVEELRRIASKLPVVNDLEGDRFSDGSTGPLRDICPFIAIGTFNRTMKAEHRQVMASGLARFLGVRVPVPLDFDSVDAPPLLPQNGWLFGFSSDRQEGDIDSLWEAFAAGRDFSASPDVSRTREDFIAAYDGARQVRQVAWNLSMGLYWAHPWVFPTLDSKGRAYLTERLHISLPKPVVDGRGYVDLIDRLNVIFGKDDSPVRSFPEMCAEAWRWSEKKNAAQAALPPNRPEPQKHDANELAEPRPEPPVEVYGVADIERDGCFLEASHIRSLLERLRDKKNLILQGPPGTGKTWLGRRLAYALVGRKDARRVRAVQFHPNLSYEDFVRGYRPSGEGRLVLVDGVFMQLVRAARAGPKSKLVLVIEEINRGHPAQIFGELLTLLEADKRNPDEALELSYPDPEDESLGKQFRLGHSYVTPSAPLDGGTRAWFEQVARSEIGPQLEEYWFDSPKTAQEQLKELLKGW